MPQNMSATISYLDRLTMALDDLLRCQRYCGAMLELPTGIAFSRERTVYEALFVAFVVSYSRCFCTSNTQNEGHKEKVSNKFGALRHRVLSSLSKPKAQLHQRILSLRNTAIAHSDATAHNHKHCGNSLLSTSQNPFYPYEHDEVALALALTEQLLSAIGQEQQKIGSQLSPNDP